MNRRRLFAFVLVKPLVVKPTIMKRGMESRCGGFCRRNFRAALGKPGDDLLSRVLRRSTIGAGAFHGRVRDGIGCGRSAKITRPAKGGERNLVFYRLCMSAPVWALTMKAIKPIERLVLVSFMHCCTSTPSLSTWWSSTALKGELVSRWVSRLDAFSGYPVRT